MSTILLAESGSTKTEWRLCRDGILTQSFRTEGLNPATYSLPEFKALVCNIFDTYVLPSIPDKIVFYGAGLRDIHQKEMLEDQLKELVPTALIILSDDLHAAAHATGRDSGIVGILGTGSNACRFQEKAIVERAGGHGYLLGDEGSGMDLGKSVLKHLLQEDFSPTLQHKWVTLLGMTPEVLRGEVYAASRPQIVLAKLTRYLTDMLDEPEIRELIANRFLLFLDTTVCRFQYTDSLTIDFVGSVSIYFKEILLTCLSERKLRLGKCIHHPIEELVKSYIFHDEIQSSG